ncbi:MAG TPA: MBL fold metallo-hydrolase [Solirubrobacteraceae bacterium]|jgi:glyoxylase-like metal-dependent hydrolase (beta-lactamase superfamily II)
MALRLTHVGPGVHRLSSVSTNWYLVEDGGRLTVLDAGFPRDWREFVSALSRLGYSPADVDAVLITHHHRDHAGNAERLRTSGARVLSHSADGPFLRGEKHLSDRGIVRYIWRPWYASFIVAAVAKGILRTPPVARLDELDNGEVVDVPGSPRVLHVPGHTAGSCALFLEERSLLFTGDALVTLDVARGPRGRQGPQVARGPHTADADLAVQSLDVLAATNARTVLPGHGEPWEDGVSSAVEIARR